MGEEEKDVQIVPNDLSHSVSDQKVSEALNLTIRLQNDLGRKCYVDPHEAFPQATYYLNTNLKRPNYYLKKEQKFNKKVLINAPNHGLNTPQKEKKRKKNKGIHKKGNNASSKMEVESESDDDDIEEEEEEDISAME